MKARIIITLADSAVLALLLICEFYHNKYADNILVLGKTWGMLQMTMLWALTLSFALKVPTLQTINNALHATKRHGRLSSAVGALTRYQANVIALVSVVFGQWTLAFAYTMFSLGFYAAAHYAKAYLASVKIDEARKTAVIDV
jgi:hypothetical protein